MTGLAVVSKVVEVQDHPNPEKAYLGVFILDSGAQMIGVNNEDGSRRFKVGDLLIHVKPGAIIPEKIINAGFENIKNGKVKASRFAGVESEGIMLNLGVVNSNHIIPDNIINESLPRGFRDSVKLIDETVLYVVRLGEDVTELLGVTS